MYSKNKMIYTHVCHPGIIIILYKLSNKVQINKCVIGVKFQQKYVGFVDVLHIRLEALSG